MQQFVTPLSKLVEQFEKLPGVGRKSAQRLAFHILSMPKDQAAAFAEAILDAKDKIRHCTVCCNLTDRDICDICDNDKRDRSVICVVEDPRDVAALEKTREYKGLYHILHGVISPMDNVGPESLKIKELITRLADDTVKEVIMATNPTIEGEATAMYLSRLIKPMGVTVTRLAYGIPVGADLEYADEVTLLRAIEGRREIT